MPTSSTGNNNRLLPRPIRTIKRNVPPATLAGQFLYHEFLKIFGDITDVRFRRQLKRSVASFHERWGEHGFWLLVSAIAEGWRVKQVYRLLTNPGYRWDLEIRNISDLTMTGFNPPIVDRLIKRCDRDFFVFADYFHKHPEFFKKYMPMLKPFPERDRHPVFVCRDTKSKTLRLFDGMRRTVLAAVVGKRPIICYTGYRVRPGKPKVNLDKVDYLASLFEAAPRDRATRRSFVRVGQEIVRQSSTGRRYFQARIKPWSDQRLRKFTEDVTKRTRG